MVMFLIYIVIKLLMDNYMKVVKLDIFIGLKNNYF